MYFHIRLLDSVDIGRVDFSKYETKTYHGKCAQTTVLTHSFFLLPHNL